MITNAKIVSVGTDPAEYHNQAADRGTPEFAMSSTPLRLFYACPAKFIRPIRAFDGSVSHYDIPASKSLQDGNTFDCALLTPDLFDRKYVITPETYPSEVMRCPSCGSETDSQSCRKCRRDREKVLIQKPWDWKSTHCKEWLARSDGKSPISKSELHDINEAIAVFYERFGRILKESQPQVWIKGVWKDEDTDIEVPIQCLIDLVPKADSFYAKSLADVKRTKSARIRAWERWAHQVGYEVQAAWNTDLFMAACPDREICTFRFLLSESHAPWETGHRGMEQDLLDPQGDHLSDIASGRRQYQVMMAAYCKCLASGKWPGYDDHKDSCNGMTVLHPDPYKEIDRGFDVEIEEPTPVPAEEGELIP